MLSWAFATGMMRMYSLADPIWSLSYGPFHFTAFWKSMQQNLVIIYCYFYTLEHDKYWKGVGWNKIQSTNACHLLNLDVYCFKRIVWALWNLDVAMYKAENLIISNNCFVEFLSFIIYSKILLSCSYKNINKNLKDFNEKRSPLDWMHI